MRGINFDRVPAVVHEVQREASPLSTLDVARCLDDIRRHDGQWSSMAAAADTRTCVAILRTIDGAERTQLVAWPPPHDIKTAICDSMVMRYDADMMSTPSFSTRRYVLHDVERDGARMLMRVIYKEQP